MQVKAAIAQVVAKYEISIDKSVPNREDLFISPSEFVNVLNHKIYLNFKHVKKIN
jgi:hypothetical protein